MPVMFKNGKVLFRNGKVAMGPACCCGPAGTCCTFDPARTLYLTIDSVSADGFPELAGFGVSGKENFGGATSSSNNTTWFTFACGDDGASVVAFTLMCDAHEGFAAGTHWLNRFSGAICFYYGDGCENPPTHRIRIIGHDEPNEIYDALMGIAVCSPFYLEATVPFELLDGGSTVIGTGTMRVIITE